MSDIKEALDRVRSKEAEASVVISRAREEEARILLQAEEQGKSEHAGIIGKAEEDGRRKLADGKAEAEKLRLQIESELKEKLDSTDKTARKNFETAVSYVIELFEKEYGKGKIS